MVAGRAQAAITLSRKADADVESIYRYSIDHFGRMKALEYMQGLQACMEQLAIQPELGRKIDSVRAGYLRYTYASHSIFYVQETCGIRVVRVLGNPMNTTQHL